MDLIDIGCNLTHDSFDFDRVEVLERARDAGVVQLVVTGASAKGSQDALRLAQSYPGELFATAGVHPHRASDYDNETDALLRDLCKQHGVVAVGEAGLDYFRDLSPRDEQAAAFRKQMQIAVDTGLPLFLHQRDAHDDFMRLLSDYRPRLGKVVVHCFTGVEAELRDYLELDCHIGITGWICDERRGHHLKDIVGLIPGNRLMLETDSPYLKPRNMRPRVKTHRNEPQWLAWIAGTVAACRGETPKATAAASTATARKFFGLPVVRSAAAA